MAWVLIFTLPYYIDDFDDGQLEKKTADYFNGTKLGEAVLAQGFPKESRWIRNYNCYKQEDKQTDNHWISLLRFTALLEFNC